MAVGCGGGGSKGGGGTNATASGSANAGVNTLESLFPGSQGGQAKAAEFPDTKVGSHKDEAIALGSHGGGGGGGAKALKPTEAALSLAAPTGGGELTVRAVRVGGEGSFSVVGDPCTGKTLPAGGSCSLTVRFAPASVGPHTAELTVDTSAADADFRAQLSGVGTAPRSSTPSPTPSVTPSPSPSSPTTPSVSVTPTGPVTASP